MSKGRNPHEIMISSALYIGRKNCQAQKQVINKNMSVKINRFIIIPPFFVWFLVLNLVNYEIISYQNMYKMNIK